MKSLSSRTRSFRWSWKWLRYIQVYGIIIFFNCGLPEYHLNVNCQPAQVFLAWVLNLFMLADMQNHVQCCIDGSDIIPNISCKHETDFPVSHWYSYSRTSDNLAKLLIFYLHVYIYVCICLCMYVHTHACVHVCFISSHASVSKLQLVHIWCLIQCSGACRRHIVAELGKQWRTLL